MRKLIIFLYFVFLFKLAFAQSLPSFPSLKGEPTQANVQMAQSSVPQLGNSNDNNDNLPGDLDLPTAGAAAPDAVPVTVNASNPAVAAPDISPQDTVIAAPPAQVIPAPTAVPSLPATPLSVDTLPAGSPAPKAANLPSSSAPAAASATASAPEATPALPNLPSQNANINIPNPQVPAAPADTSILGDANRNQFPATPALNFNEKQAPAATAAAPAAPAPVATSEQREKDVDNLLNQVFDQQKSKDDLAKEQEDAAEDKKAEADAKKTKQDDSPMSETVVNVDEKPVQPIDGLKSEDQMDLSDLPASMKKDGKKSPFKDNVVAKGSKSSTTKDSDVLAESPEQAPSTSFSSTTYSEMQLSDLLVKAAKDGDRNSVVQLLNSGRKADSRNSYGETALMVSIYNNHPEITDVLLSAGANPNITDNKGNNALMVAAARNDTPAIAQLVKAGANIDQSNNIGDTPLLVSTLNGNLDAVKLLVHQGANINKANADGLTPLHVAAYSSNPAIVQYLLSAGANPTIIARGGYKPYDLAKDPQSQQLLANATPPAPLTKVATQAVEVKSYPTMQTKSDVAFGTKPVANIEVSKAPAKNAQLANSDSKPKPASMMYDKKWTKLTNSPADVNAKPQAAPVEPVTAENEMPAATPAEVAPIAPAVETVANNTSAPTQPVLVRAHYDNYGHMLNALPTATPAKTEVAKEEPKAPIAPATAPQTVAQAAPAKPASMASAATVAAPTTPVNNISVSQVEAPQQKAELVPAPRIPAPQYAAPQNNAATVYERSTRNDYAASTPAPAMESAPELAPAPAEQPGMINASAGLPASLNFDRMRAAQGNNISANTAPTVQPLTPETVAAASAPSAPLTSVPVVTPAPRIPVYQASAAPVITSAPAVTLPANLNIPRYAELEPAKQAVWDNKLEEWVRNGMNIQTQDQAQQVYWLKQQKVLQAVYQNQFDVKVQQAKQKVASGAYNTFPTSSHARISVQEKPVRVSDNSVSNVAASQTAGYENVFSVQ